jgi:hypothetical protein
MRHRSVSCFTVASQLVLPVDPAVQGSRFRTFNSQPPLSFLFESVHSLSVVVLGTEHLCCRHLSTFKIFNSIVFSCIGCATAKPGADLSVRSDEDS